jgi:predicted RNA-binding Zn-ribbon protein involved in translation (DUF1610 family)
MFDCPKCGKEIETLLFKSGEEVSVGTCTSDENFEGKEVTRNAWFYCPECKAYLGEYDTGFSVTEFFEEHGRLKAEKDVLRILKERGVSPTDIPKEAYQTMIDRVYNEPVYYYAEPMVRAIIEEELSFMRAED